MSIEGEMLKYINVARQFPAYYISLIDKQLESFINDKQIPISQEMIYETNEGKKVWKEARKFLQKQTTLPPFQIHEGLNLSAKDHAQDLSIHNIFGHTGSDKSTFSDRILKYCKKGQGAMAEIIGADFHIQGRNNAELTILGLIIDDGVVDRGHRKTVFNPQYRYIGCKSQIQNDKIITVFNLTENRLQFKGQQSTLSYEDPRFTQSNNSNSFKPQGNSRIVEPNFNKTDTTHFKKETPTKKYSAQPVFQELSQNLPAFRSSISPNKLGASKYDPKNGKKVSERKENTRIFYQQGTKVTQKYTQIFYSDGTMQENIQKHTVYT